MLVLSLVTLTIASLSAFLSLKTQEDVVKAAMACTAIIAIFLTLVLAPWLLKLTIVAIPVAIGKLNNWSAEKL
jgi:hypothetical protein